MLPCGAGGLGRSHDSLDAPTTPPPSGKVISVSQPRRATLAERLTDPRSTCEVAHQLTLMVWAELDTMQKDDWLLAVW